MGETQNLRGSLPCPQALKTAYKLAAVLPAVVGYRHSLHRRVDLLVVVIKAQAATGSRISRMKPIPWRVQLGAVAAGYAMVFLVGGALVFERHIQYVNNPADAASYGAMYAFGDLILGLFIGGLFRVPTLLLVLVIRKSEAAYTRYSQTVLGFSLTAPVCLGIFLIPAVNEGTRSWAGFVWVVCWLLRSLLPGWQPAGYWRDLPVPGD